MKPKKVPHVDFNCKKLRFPTLFLNRKKKNNLLPHFILSLSYAYITVFHHQLKNVVFDEILIIEHFIGKEEKMEDLQKFNFFFFSGV